MDKKLDQVSGINPFISLLSIQKHSSTLWT